MHRSVLIISSTVLLSLGLTTTATGAPTVMVGGADGSDDKVSDQTYVRHDGGTDVPIQQCSSDATDPAPDTNPNDGDSDSNDGGGERQNNEPAVAVDPTNPSNVVASWNEYCNTDLGIGFMGLGFSTDSGETWVDSLTPGYPGDTSTEGMQSPLFGTRTDGSDPLLAFNSEGDLYTAGIAFNDAMPTDSAIYVTTWAGHPAGPLPYDYERTAIVGKAGTPSLITGHFTDKPMMEVDRTDSVHNGNVYVCWSRFVGAAGRTKIFFSRSTDDGRTFSPQVSLSSGRDVQGCDITVEADGDVYVIWGTRDTTSGIDQEGVGIARSADGGATFSPAREVGTFHRYFPFDSGRRDCGDGTQVCPSQFVFARVPLEPRVTSDPTGKLPGVFVTYNAIDDATVTQSGTSYDSAGPGSGLVGRGVAFVTRSTDNGQTWGSPVRLDNAGGSGHQFFPDVDALDGTLVAVWQDNRGSDFTVQRPIGNTAAATSSGATVGTFAAYSTNGTTFTPLGMISSIRQPMQYEMFANRSVPFLGDYNWVSLASTAQGLTGYLTWTDNRDVVAGTDVRETTQDGFDVLQCRTGSGATAGPDTCPNAGGLDQNIYGTSLQITP